MLYHLKLILDGEGKKINPIKLEQIVRKNLAEYGENAKFFIHLKGHGAVEKLPGHEKTLSLHQTRAARTAADCGMLNAGALAEGPVLGDGGYLLELEKRGYVQAGPFTPEVVIDQLAKASELGAADYFPVSARSGKGIPQLVEHLASLLPEGPMYFPAETISDQPEELWVAELVREQLLAVTRDELPYSIATRVTEWEWPRVRVEIGGVVDVGRVHAHRPCESGRGEDVRHHVGRGQAARSWEAFDAIVRSLRDLADDETLLVQSGKPVGVMRTHEWAPRVLIANSNLVGKWANWEHFRDLERQGLTVQIAHSGEAGLECLDDLAPEVVLLDYNLPGIDGLTVLERIMARRPKTRRVCCGGSPRM